MNTYKINANLTNSNIERNIVKNENKNIVKDNSDFLNQNQNKILAYNFCFIIFNIIYITMYIYTYLLKKLIIAN